MTNNLVLLNSSQMHIPGSIEDCALDFESLSHTVKTLTQQHSELIGSAVALKSPFYRICRKVLKKFLRRKEHSVEEILNFQLSVIRQLRRDLESQTARGKKYLDTIVEHSITRSKRLESANTYQHNEGPLIIQEKKEIETNTKELLKEDRKKPGYYTREEGLRQKIRAYDDHKHVYALAGKEISDILAQRQHMDREEGVVRCSVHSSKTIIEITKRIEEHISVLRGAYDCVIKQYKSYPHLIKALEIQRAYIAGIDNVLVHNQNIIAALTNSAETVKSSYPTTYNLEAMVETMQISSELRREEVENNSTSVFTE